MAVQIGSAYLMTKETIITEAHRQAILLSTDDGTQITNIFTRRPARGIINRAVREIGPM